MSGSNIGGALITNGIIRRPGRQKKSRIPAKTKTEILAQDLNRISAIPATMLQTAHPMGINSIRMGRKTKDCGISRGREARPSRSPNRLSRKISEEIAPPAMRRTAENVMPGRRFITNSAR
jgi:hypothetical protein